LPDRLPNNCAPDVSVVIGDVLYSERVSTRDYRGPCQFNCSFKSSMRQICADWYRLDSGAKIAPAPRRTLAVQSVPLPWNRCVTPMAKRPCVSVPEFKYAKIANRAGRKLVSWTRKYLSEAWLPLKGRTVASRHSGHLISKSDDMTPMNHGRSPGLRYQYREPFRFGDTTCRANREADAAAFDAGAEMSITVTDIDFGLSERPQRTLWRRTRMKSSLDY